MRKLAAAIKRPVTFALVQHDMEPDQYKRMLDLSAEAAAEGAKVTPQVGGRPTRYPHGLADHRQSFSGKTRPTLPSRIWPGRTSWPSFAIPRFASA